MDFCLENVPFSGLFAIEKKSNKKRFRRDFSCYLKDKINKNRFLIGKSDKIQIKISQKESHNVVGLQTRDFIANAIFRKYESRNYEGYNIIKNQIVTEKKFLF